MVSFFLRESVELEATMTIVERNLEYTEVEPEEAKSEKRQAIHFSSYSADTCQRKPFLKNGPMMESLNTKASQLLIVRESLPF